MTLKGTCIGGPWHGRAIMHYSAHLKVEHMDLYRFAYSSRLSVWYVHLKNEFGDWWVVE